MQMKYVVKKNGNKVFAGASDACQDIEKANEKNEDIRGTLQKYGLPDKCPVDNVFRYWIVSVLNAQNKCIVLNN